MGRIRSNGPTRDNLDRAVTSGIAPSPITSDFYFSAKGRKYGSWISDSGRSVGYSTSDFIEQPAYIIESILRDELGISAIDTASFDLIGNASTGLRKDWKFARSINTIENSIKIIDRICYEAFLLWTRDNTGNIKLSAIETNPSTAYVIEQNQMKREPIMSFSHHSFIRNIFDVGYKRNYSRNSFDKSFFVDPIQSSIEDLTENITNGTFPGSSVADWSDYGTGSRLGVSSTMVITSSASNDGVSQDAIINIVSGRKYTIALSQTITSGTWKIRLSKTLSHSGTMIGGFTEQTLSGASTSYSFTATESGPVYFLIYCSSAGTNNLTIDNVSMLNKEFLNTDFTPDESSAIYGYGGGSSNSLCGISHTRYKVKNLFKDDLSWINEEATAKLFLKKMIEWRYAPHILADVLGWWGDTTSSTRKPLISYQIGDQVYLDHPSLDSGISNSYVFIVQGKTIYRNERLVRLNLISMR